MRPLWYEFPQDQNTFAMDDEYLLGLCVALAICFSNLFRIVKEYNIGFGVYLGDALLVKPVTEENTKSLDVYFPGSSAEVGGQFLVNVQSSLN